MFEELQEQIPHLINKNPNSKEVLEAYEAILGICRDAKPVLPETSMDQSLVRLKQEEGFPLFSREDLPLDMECASDLLVAFFMHLGERQPHMKKAFEKAIQELRQDESLAQKLFSSVLARDMEALQGISQGWGLPAPMLYFLAVTALKPSLSLIRKRYVGALELTTWEQGYCPLCGSEPYMAYLDKKGKRHLHCELCGTQWPYPRVKCPFCQNQDQESLGYFHPEGDEGIRVYFCRKCSRYIKTIDRRVFERETSMDLEYLATLHLDILAEKEGFK